MGGGKIRRSSPQRGPGAEPRWVEVPKKMNNFTVIAGEFLRILRVTAKHFTSMVCIKFLQCCCPAVSGTPFPDGDV